MNDWTAEEVLLRGWPERKRALSIIGFWLQSHTITYDHTQESLCVCAGPSSSTPEHDRTGSQRWSTKTRQLTPMCYPHTFIIAFRYLLNERCVLSGPHCSFGQLSEPLEQAKTIRMIQSWKSMAASDQANLAVMQRCHREQMIRVQIL